MSSEQKIKVPIQGMHCKACEILLEGELTEIKGVNRAEVNHQKGEADIYYEDEKPRLEHITEVVEKAGYIVG